MNTVFDMLVGIFKELQYQRTIDKTTNIQGYKMMHNKVNINRLQQDMQEARDNIEKLKDKIRENGSHD